MILFHNENFLSLHKQINNIMRDKEGKFSKQYEIDETFLNP